ncbi:unnamed protein product [Lactuca saligna]|uniref:RING-type E3 ubiquitin transferase n=1 Tax=Lactuca saligna TaxID=75948 RepID=A0AA35VHI9_LACSI|nr:unnamed protein product [Lactuca saligna]
MSYIPKIIKVKLLPIARFSLDKSSKLIKLQYGILLFLFSVVNRTAPANFASFLQDLTNKCEAVLGRRGMESMPWPYYQGPSSSQPTIAQSSSSGSSSSGTSVSFMRHQKGSIYSPGGVNLQSTTSEKESKKGTPLMAASDKVNTISVDDEDVCPICLEEYTSENPRIITKCAHHYHLSCIYEWNERSKTCPVCSKLMVFEEMA